LKSKIATSAGNTIIWACIRNRYCSENMGPFKSRLGLGWNVPPIVVYKNFCFFINWISKMAITSGKI
jgi:hypothetical protein